MNKKVAILQSNYVPWKGYFDLISLVDEFIIYDDMQYTKRDWRNRNYVKTANGLKWLTIPVEVKGKFFQKIKETRVSDKKWINHHIKIIAQNYAKSKYYSHYYDRLYTLYEKARTLDYLSDINFLFIREICDLMNINTKLSWSSDYRLSEGKTERLVNLCLQAEATEYISGPAAKNYISAELFASSNIKLTWMDYSGYESYHQLFPPFEHGVSIIDLILNEGPFSRNFMKYTR